MNCATACWNDRATVSDDGRNGFVQILRTDRKYARYQLHQFTSGVAAMMLEPALVYLVSKQLGASYVVSIGIIMIIPFAMNLITLPLWGRYLDKVHVAEFRARQNAMWVLGVLIMFWGALTGSLAWIAAGRLVNGIVNGGGSLAWQLGHNDFAPRDQLAAYMGIHVTLTGVRGAFAPFLGMALYLGLEQRCGVAGNAGPRAVSVHRLRAAGRDGVARLQHAAARSPNGHTAVVGRLRMPIMQAAKPLFSYRKYLGAPLRYCAVSSDHGGRDGRARLGFVRHRHRHG